MFQISANGLENLRISLSWSRSTYGQLSRKEDYQRLYRLASVVFSTPWGSCCKSQLGSRLMWNSCMVHHLQDITNTLTEKNISWILFNHVQLIIQLITKQSRDDQKRHRSWTGDRVRRVAIQSFCKRATDLESFLDSVWPRLGHCSYLTFND